MQLSTLLEGFIGENVEITGITSSSNDVKPGYLFIALPSLSGKDIKPFINEALKKGASAVITTPSIRRDYDTYPVNFISSDNPRKDLALIASRFFKEKPDVMAAVTGTNGKTSTAEFTRQFWEAASYKAASIGTLGLVGEMRKILMERSLTSPDTIMLHGMLQKLKKEGYTHAILEASSHGLHQHKLEGLPIKVAAFTNLSQDHLDYHETLENYFQAKSLLFTQILHKEGTAVLNRDMSFFPQLEALCQERDIPILSYGKQGQDIKILTSVVKDHGYSLQIQIETETKELFFPLAGEFQILNGLCAAGIAFATGVSRDTLFKTLETLQGVPGRLEYVGSNSQGGRVYVDYAHTPDALKEVLKAIKPHTLGKVWVIFGCGGNRDALKRPLMGDVARQWAHKIIITDDNPREEDPFLIRKQILKQCPTAQEIPHREEAIHTAIKSLEGGDVLVVAGKGHEKSQIIGDQSVPFDDIDVVQTCLKKDSTP